MFDTSRFSPSALHTLFRRFQQANVSSPFIFALLVILSTLPAMWPFFANTGYWVSHDGLFHLYRLLSLEEAWQQGYVYPRTFPDFAFGYGFAVLNFYGPLTYYVALAMRAIGFSALGAMKATFALSYPLSALAMWWLARDVWQQRQGHDHEWAGVVAAIVYTYVPYHMADVQLRGALAESWAFVWWPLLFWAVWRVRVWPLAFGLAGLVLTHNLSVILVAFPLAGWALLTGSTERLKSLGRLGLSGVIALPMTAFYWLPVLLESPYIWIAQDVGGLGFERHLAPLQTWVTAGPSYHYFPNQGVQAEHPLSWPQVGVIGLALLVAIGRAFFDRKEQKSSHRNPGPHPPAPSLGYGRGGEEFEKGIKLPLSHTLERGLGGEGQICCVIFDRKEQKSSQSITRFLFWLLIFAGVIFLLTPFSRLVWQTFVFPFGLIQYPWRWLGIGSLATAMLASYAFIFLNGYFVRLNALFFPVLLAWLAFTSLQHLPWEAKEVDVTRHPVQMWQEDAANGQVGATWTAEFLPLTVKEQRWALARAPEQIDAAQVGQRSALRIKRAGGDGFSFWAEVESSKPEWLVFPRFAYPSMQATIRPLESSRSDVQHLSVTPVGTLGLAGIEVPEGIHHVQLAAYPLANQPLLLWGLGILSLALLLYGITRWSKWGLLLLPLMALLFFLTRQPEMITSFDPPPLFGTQVQLVAVRHPSSPAKAGQDFPLRLLWFNLEQTDQFYSTFVHLTPVGGGPPLASHDSQPNMNTVPSPRWLAGQLVEDLHLLSLPEELAPGEYELWGGLYTFQDETVVPIAGDSGERRFLGVISVQ